MGDSVRQAAPEPAECSRVVLVELAVVSVRLKVLVPVLALFLMLSVPSLASAAGFKWNKGIRLEASSDGGLDAVSCANSKFCVAGDQSGNILFTTKPTGGSGSWSATEKVDTAGAITGVSCPTTSFCAAVDQVGAFVYSTQPTKGAKFWSHPVRIDSSVAVGGGYAGLTAISCPSSTLCVAIDNAANSNVVYSTDPTGGKTAWHTVALEGPATSVDCPTTSLCVIGGSQRYVSTDPSSPTSWKAGGAVAGEVYQSVDCVGTTLCIGVGFGDTTPGFASATSSATGTWGAAFPVESNPPALGTGLLDTVGCTRGTCVALDGSDNAYVSSTPSTGVWGAGAAIRTKSASQWNAVSCTSCICVVVDSAGVETTGMLS
jgi:hypothetical protein